MTKHQRVLIGVVAVLVVALSAPAAQAGSRTYDTPGTYLYRVPATVTSLGVTAVGGNGGSQSGFGAAAGGRGRFVTQTLAVTPGEMLQVNVGGVGFNPGGFTPGGGGFNGGGATFTSSGGGGGASDVRRASFGAADRVVVAGGGGGAGTFAPGGDAGSDGSDGTQGPTPGNGGTAGAGGVGGAGGPPSDACCSGGTNGTATNGGNAGTGNLNGGGGGGGYGGGGGGSGGVTSSSGGGGAGGGSLGTPAGFNASPSGNGSVTLTHTATTVEVINTLSPPSDPGLFDLKVDGTTALADAGNGDTTYQQVVSNGPAITTVEETAGTDTVMFGYDSAIACDNGASGTGPGPLDLTVPATDSVICTITNTRLSGTLRVVNRMRPASDPGRFDLRVDGAVERAAAGDGEGTGPLAVDAGLFEVDEAAVAPANAGDYITAIECRDGGGAIVASAATAAPLDVPVRGGADVTCTFTNTRPGTLRVVNRMEPASDPGRFDLQIDGVTRRSGAGDGEGTGPVALDPGTWSVGETAVAPASAADYTTEIECRDGSGAGAIVASASTAGPLDVPVGAGANVACIVTNVRKPHLDPLAMTLYAAKGRRLARSVRVGAVCSRACDVGAQGKIVVRTAKPLDQGRLARSVRFGLADATASPAGGQRVNLELGLSAAAHDRVERALQKPRSRANAKLRVWASDGDGDRVFEKRKIRLRP